MTPDLAIEEREALVSALVRLKFNEGYVPEPYFGSPFVGEALLKLLSSVVEESEQSGDTARASRWRSWQNWAAREHEQKMIVDYPASLPNWAEVPYAERREFFRHCAVPFPLSDADLQDLIDRVQAARG